MLTKQALIAFLKGLDTDALEAFGVEKAYDGPEDGHEAIKAIKSWLGGRPLETADGESVDLNAVFEIESDNGGALDLAVGKAAPPKAPEPKKQITTVELKAARAKVPHQVHVTAPRYGGRLKNLEDPERAYRLGQFFSAAIMGAQKSISWCTDNGIALKAQTEGVNSAGGYLVPDEFIGDIIHLQETRGVARSLCNVQRMARDTASRPRFVSGLTAYAVGEGTSITESQNAYDNVNLVARKWATLTRYSSELGEDAYISIGDEISGQIAYAFANAEDQALINGDGTSTYHGISGLITNIGSASTHTPGTGTGDESWATIDLAAHHATVSLLPDYAHKMGNVRWVCSRQYFAQAMQRLAYAGGGNTVDTITGGTGQQFLGYPVVFSQVMPTATAVSTISAYLGAFELGCMFGDRREITVAMSEHRYFDSDEIGVRGTTRFDINVHDAGDSSTAGPIVALKTAAS